MNDCAEAVKEADNSIEVFSEMSGPREPIVVSLCQSTNQRLVVTCAISSGAGSKLAWKPMAEQTFIRQTCLSDGKGDFPFPFQAFDQFIESEVKGCMQEITFYCKQCKKSMRISYNLSGDDETTVMNGLMLKCHTHKCTRVVIPKNYTEGQLRKGADASRKYYL